MFSKRLLVISMLVFALALAACQPIPADGEAGPQTYTLGVALPFTGSLGSFGTDFSKGVELAVEQMNAELSGAGSNVQFTIVDADTEGTPDGAAKAVQTIVQSSGAAVVVGPLTTGEVLGAKQFADENDVVLVAPASSAPSAAIPGDNIFRVMYPPDTFAGQAFQQIALTRGYENVVILHMDDPFGNGLSEVFTTGFQAAGGGEVVSISYAPEPTDLSGEVSSASAEVARLSAEGTTVFFCICFLGDAQIVLQQATVDATLGGVDWMGVENLATPDILEDSAHAAFLSQVGLTSVSFSSKQTPNTQPFIDDFSAKFGSEPGPFTNYAYDAANIAMLSMVSANNSGPGVKSILPFIANHYIGTAVQTFLDENGDQAVVSYGIFEVNAEGTEFVEVGAYDGASGEVTFK